MNPNHQTKRQALSICLLTLLIASAAAIFSAMPSAQAAAIPINVIGADSVSHPISDIATLTQTVGSGGYKNQGATLYWGNYQGVSLLTLCNSIGTALTSNQNVTVTTSGGSGNSFTFNYDQVANGLSISSQYNTYSNITGQATAQTQPVTLIVAYQFINGTKIPGSSTTRLLIVGQEGLLFEGSGFAGVETITITNNPPVATPTPTIAPTNPPTNAPSNPTATSHPTAKPTATPTAQPTPTPNATSTASPTPTEIVAPSSDMTFTYAIVILVVVVIVIAVVAVALSRRHRA